MQSYSILWLSIVCLILFVTAATGQQHQDDEEQQPYQHQQQHRHQQQQEEQSNQHQEQQEQGYQQQEPQQRHQQADGNAESPPTYRSSIQQHDDTDPSSPSHDQRGGERESDQGDTSGVPIPQSPHRSQSEDSSSGSETDRSHVPESPSSTYHQSDYGHSEPSSPARPSVSVYSFMGRDPSGSGPQDHTGGSLGGSESQTGFQYSFDTESHPTYGHGRASSQTIERSAGSTSSSSPESPASGYPHVTSYSDPTGHQYPAGDSSGHESKGWSTPDQDEQSSPTKSYTSQY